MHIPIYNISIMKVFELLLQHKTLSVTASFLRLLFFPLGQQFVLAQSHSLPNSLQLGWLDPHVAKFFRNLILKKQDTADSHVECNLSKGYRVGHVYCFTVLPGHPPRHLAGP